MNPLIEIISIVGKYSPAVASALGSPFAGLVATLLANVFKADPGSTLDILEKLKTDPEAERKIKEIERDHERDLAMLNDMQSARNREVSYTAATKQRDWMLPILAIVVAVGFFVTIWLVIHLDVPVHDKYFMYGLILGVGVQFAQVYNYYFGQSTNDVIALLSAPFAKAYNGIFKSKP